MPSKIKERKGKVEMRSGTAIYMHIPKTGGSTFNHMLKTKYKGKPVFVIDNNRPVASIREGLGQLDDQQKKRLKLVYGHMYYGAHQYLHEEYSYFTMLRHPVDRVISLYKEILRNPQTEICKYVIANNVSLKELVTSGRYHELNNDQTKRIAGETPAYGECNDALLQKAELNLSKDFCFVGIQERFDESLLLMKKELDWKVNPYYLMLNRSVKEKKIDVDVDEDTIEVIEAYNQQDLALYGNCLEQFNDLTRKHIQYLNKNLESFRRKNIRYQKLGNAYLKFKKWL